MRIYGTCALMVILAGIVPAQRTAGNTATPPAAGPAATTGRTTNTNTPSNTNNPQDNGLSQRPIFIAGTVVISDGTPLTDRAKIERVCGGNVRLETYTDRKGRFNFEVGHSMEMQDASMGSSEMNGPGSALGGMRNSGSAMGRMGNSPERQLWGCDLRATLPGFRSDVVSLTNIRPMDDPNVGTIILHRLGKVDGLTISVLSAQAPKDARKAYEKGQEAVAKRKLKEAQEDFEKAVELYPKYSVAWFELGRVYEQADRLEDARKSYSQAIAVEPKYLAPQERLAWVALRESKWQELVERTDQWLRLDPLNSPDAYYLSSVGNLQTQHSDIAEKNAREAVRLDPSGKNMRTRYVLGLALAQNHDFTASAQAIRSYLDAKPQEKDNDFIRKQLEQIEEAAREKTQAKPE